MTDFIPLTQAEKDRDAHDGYFEAIEVRARWAAKGTVTGCQVRVWSVMEAAA